MDKVGRKTILTEELFKEIKKSILEGNDLKETANICGINEGTFYVWHSDNYLSLADKIEGWRRDRKLMLAEKNLEDFLSMDTTNNVLRGDDYVQINDTGLVRVKADLTKFTLETLNKDNYSKRNEQTGKDGKDLIVQVINYGDSDTKQIPTERVSDTDIPSDR